jgi:hypothetical protein
MAVYPGSGKEGPTSSEGYCIFLHRSACIGLQAVREGTGLKSQKKVKMGCCLGC